jgi:hypothetical protein
MGNAANHSSPLRNFGGLYIAGTVLPIILLIYWVSCLGVDIPSWDEWGEGTPFIFNVSAYPWETIQHLWEQHNEHRIFFPRLLMWVLASISSWNIIWEMAASIVVAVATFLVLCGQLQRLVRSAPQPLPRIVWPVLSLLFFSMTQWENWLWGFQLAWSMVSLGVIWGFSSLVKWQDSGATKDFVLALLCGVVASYSSAQGLFYWPAGIVMMLVWPKPHKPPAYGIYLSLWCVICLAVALGYFHGYQQPPAHRLFYGLWQHPLQYAGTYVLFVLLCLGSPVADTTPLIALIQGAGLLLVFLLLCCDCVTGKVDMRKLNFFLGLGIFALLNVMAIAGARIDFGGIGFALVPRYITISTWLWISLIVTTAYMLRQSPLLMKRKWYPVVRAVAMLAIISYADAVPWARKHSEILAAARTHILEHYPDTLDDNQLRILYPDTTNMRQWIAVLARKHLSLFRE